MRTVMRAATNDLLLSINEPIMFSIIRVRKMSENSFKKTQLTISNLSSLTDTPKPKYIQFIIR